MIFLEIIITFNWENHANTSGKNPIASQEEPIKYLLYFGFHYHLSCGSCRELSIRVLPVKALQLTF